MLNSILAGLSVFRLQHVEDVLSEVKGGTETWNWEFPRMNLLAKIAHKSLMMRRRKRSSSFRDFQGRGGWGMAFNKETITWRLVGTFEAGLISSRQEAL